jgi:hypothetical protein
VEGQLDAGSGGVLVEMVEHHHGALDEGRGVGDALACDVRGRAVDRLEDGVLGADVGPGDDAEAADQAGAEVGQDVAVEVLGDDDVEPVRVAHHVHGGGVDDDLLELDGGVAGGHAAGAVEHQAVGHLHDVGLVHRGDAAAAVLGGVLEGVLGDAGAALVGDELDALGYPGEDHDLVARVEVFRVLADDDQIDALEARLDVGQAADGADVGVEVKDLPERDVDRLEALADGRTDGPLEGDPGAADRVDGLVGERGAGAGGHLGADVLRIPVDLDAGGLEDALGSSADLGANSVARDERDLVRHDADA